jgi:hypothetical protein
VQGELLSCLLSRCWFWWAAIPNNKNKGKIIDTMDFALCFQKIIGC